MRRMFKMPVSQLRRCIVNKAFYCSMLFLLMVIPNTLVAEEISDSSLARIMNLSGSIKQMAEIPEMIKTKTYQTGTQEQLIPKADLTRLFAIIEDAFKPPAILSSLWIEIKRNLTEADAEQLMRWYESDVGRMITIAEERATKPEAFKEMFGDRESLLSDEHRVSLAMELDGLLYFSRLNVQLQKGVGLSVRAALAKIRNPDEPVDIEAIKLHMSSLEPQMNASADQLSKLSLVYRYKDIDTESMEKYLDFLRQPSTKKLNDSVLNSLYAAFNQPVEKMTKALAESPGEQVNEKLALNITITKNEHNFNKTSTFSSPDHLRLAIKGFVVTVKETSNSPMDRNGARHFSPSGSVEDTAKSSEGTTTLISAGFTDTRMSNSGISNGSDWLYESLSPGIWLIKHQDWDGFYWLADAESENVYRVQGDYISATGEASQMKSFRVTLRTGHTKDNKPFQTYSLISTSGIFHVNLVDGSSSVIVEGTNIPMEQKFVATPQNETILQIKRSDWSKTFSWEADIAQEKFYSVWRREDGSIANRQPNKAFNFQMLTDSTGRAPTFDPNRNNVKTLADFGVYNDLGYSEVVDNVPEPSKWLTKQKKIFYSILRKINADILIVPFQVQHYALDRAGRSLMTRYLIDQIERSTNTKVYAPSLVDKALGTASRRYDLDEIYDLANKTTAKFLIHGYVGHRRDMKMYITLLIQKRGSDGFVPLEGIQTVTFKGLAFSDNILPSEVFIDLLPKIMSEFPLEQQKKLNTVHIKERYVASMPETIDDVFEKPPESPVEAAFLLQMLGVLSPETSNLSEFFFERSLVALRELSPNAPDYSLLKARALLYLERRPAAIVALGKVKTPAEGALLAFMNGDLDKLRKLTNKITSPVLRLMSDIETYSVERAYTGKQLDRKALADIVGRHPALEQYVVRSLLARDEWYVPQNLLIKDSLDHSFPLPGPTAKDLSLSQSVLGASNESVVEIDLSVYNHRKELLAGDNIDIFSKIDSPMPAKYDQLDLLYYTSEANLIKKIKNLYKVKGLRKEALELLDEYGVVYKDHPTFTFYQREILYEMGRNEVGKKQKELVDSGRTLGDKALYWEQGQSTYGGIPRYFPFYIADFPSRTNWRVEGGNRKHLEGKQLYDKLSKNKDKLKRTLINKKQPADADKFLNDLKERLILLDYTMFKFNALESLYESLISLGYVDDAEEILKQNEHRFSGNPLKFEFLANIYKEKGEEDRVKSLCESEILLNPTSWKPYDLLARLYIESGDFKKAQEAYLKYPGFQPDYEMNAVKISNQAHTAAYYLLTSGAIDEAIPLYEISAASQTGAWSEINSSVVLSILDNNFEAATYHALRGVQRYKDKGFYDHYLSLLFVIGYDEEAWAAFKSSDYRKLIPEAWHSTMIGLKAKGMTPQKLDEWFKEQGENRNFPPTGRLWILTQLLDRPVHKVNDKIELTEPQRDKRFINYFAKAYIAFKNRKYAETVKIFYKAKREDYMKSTTIKGVPQKHNPLLKSFTLYTLYALQKTKQLHQYDEIINAYERIHGKDFNYYLAHAVEAGLVRNYDESIDALKMAQFRTPNTWEGYIFPWYQMVETAEWLYLETGHDKYRELCIEWAKINQRMNPLDAWAYACEAKWSYSVPDKIRALAITLYLDKHSERIMKLSEQEKQQALEWLEENNPFLNRDTQQEKVAI